MSWIAQNRNSSRPFPAAGHASSPTSSHCLKRAKSCSRRDLWDPTTSDGQAVPATRLALMEAEKELTRDGGALGAAGNSCHAWLCGTFCRPPPHSHSIISRSYNNLKSLINFSNATVCSGEKTAKKLRC